MDPGADILPVGALVAAFLIGGGVMVLFYYVLKLFRNEGEEVAKAAVRNKSDQSSPPSNKKKEVHTSAAVKKKKSAHPDNQPHKQGFTSPWLLTTLKGHTGPVLDLDYSSNGKYLASCGEDRAVLLWDVRDLSQKEHKSLRVNIDFDHPTFVKWSPDSKAFIVQKYNENVIEVYKVDRKKDGWLGPCSKLLTFPKAHENDVIGIGIAPTGKYIMTCSNKTDLVVWDLKGTQLGQVDTYLMSTTCAKISPCGRFVVATGFAPDAKVWEVLFTKSGEFQEVKRVFELSGHTSGIFDVAFDSDSSHMVTVSKDGTWKLFDTNVEYKKGESPHLKTTAKYEQLGPDSKIALSPNAQVVVIATANNLSFFAAKTGVLDKVLEDVFQGNITALMFDATGKFLLVSGDKQIRVFHNVSGYRTEIVDARDKLKTQNVTSATRERLQGLISGNQEFLNEIKGKENSH